MFEALWKFAVATALAETKSEVGQPRTAAGTSGRTFRNFSLCENRVKDSVFHKRIDSSDISLRVGSVDRADTPVLDLEAHHSMSDSIRMQSIAATAHDEQ